MNTAERTRRTVGEYLSRVGGSRPERIAELFDPAVEWRVSWPVEAHPLVPWIRPRVGRAGVADHFRAFAEACDQRRAEVSLGHTVVSGPDAVVTGFSGQYVKATGKSFVMAFALHLTVEGGLITRHHMYEDSLAVVEAFLPD